ncbi:MAG: reprolysin-like metallopeptidase [Bacteroidota bacterium]
MKKLIIALCFYSCIFSNLLAQNTNSPLREIEEAVVSDSPNNGERTIVPNNYKILQLDAGRLTTILNSAPTEDASGNNRSAPFELLLSNGEIASFYLVEYAMMEPALAAQFPSFKTYYGYGVNDPQQRIRLDWTSNGLNAMMQLADGLAFLKPYASGDTEHYLSYFESDLPLNTQPFSCGTVDDKYPERTDTDSGNRAGDCQLRTYRLAVAVTGEYATSTLGASSAGTAADDAIVTAHIVTSINQINEWYERDLAARFLLIDNLSDIFYYNGDTDPYTNDDALEMLDENISNLDIVIGDANFDIGHVMGRSGGSSGVAGRYTLCGASKARGVTRASASGINQPRFLKVWAHELGHQFGAGHTQGEDCQRSASSAMEPGAGTTLMSYVTSNCDNQLQNVPDYYFHAISMEQMSEHMLSTTCADMLASPNSAPTVSAGPDVTVPNSTPLLLQATATDPDNDVLTFTWEQYNNEVAEAIPPQPTNTLGPSFRSLPPSNGSGRYLPNLTAVIDGVTPTWEVLPSVARTMDFRVTVRDNSTNNIACTAEDDITITTTANGPFRVTSPASSGVIWLEDQPHTVSWDVAGTNVPPVSCANVDILLSYDGGFTYPVVLANSVPNTGTAEIIVPTGVSTTARVQVRCSDNIFYNISADDFEIQISSGPTFLLNLPSTFSTICQGDIASNLAISTSAFSGFIGDVELSANNLPGSASLTFDSPIISAGSGTTFEIANTAGLAEGNYMFSITGTSGSIVRTIDYVLVIEEPVGLTTLELPADNAVDIGIIPILSWEPRSNAISYAIQVSSDPSFTNVVVDETVSTNFYSLNMSLAGLTDYYWRVKTTTGCGETPWSSIREFTTTDCAAAFIENVPVSITSSGTPVVTSTITITGPGTIDGLEISNIIGTHTYMSDLSVELIAPDGGPTVLLWDRECGSNDDFNLSLSDFATVPVSDAPCNSFGQGGTFIPENPLSVFNGLPIAGDWTLRINDNANLDGGELLTWRLDFCSLIGLPVELLSFNAFGQEKTIHLDWETTNEYENVGFEIERRTESQAEFTIIGEVPAVEDTRAINSYNFLDEEVRPGILYYYRLRQNDVDGQFEYSPIRTAKIEGNELGLQVYPNPARGELFGFLDREASEETELRLYDLNGRVIRKQTTYGNQFTMDLVKLPAGLYVLKANHLMGEEAIRLLVN